MLPNKIYYWQDLDRIIGAMKVKTNDVDLLYGYGYIIEDSPLLKEVMKQRGKDTNRDFSVMNRKRAITQVKTCLANVWNALNVHGKKILDEKGEIDIELYKLHENNIRIQSGLIVDTNLTHPFRALKDFKSMEIKLKRAEEFQLI